MGRGWWPGRGGEDLKEIGRFRTLTTLLGVALGRIPTQGRSSLLRGVRPFEDQRAHAQRGGHCHVQPSREILLVRDLPGDWLEQFGLAAAVAEGILWRRGGPGEQSGCVPDGPLQPKVT